MIADFLRNLGTPEVSVVQTPMRIHAAGLCCAVGYHLKAAHCALRAHMDHFQESEFRDKQGHPLLVARLPEIQLWGQPRLARWLELALRDCLQAVPGLDAEQIPLIWLAPEASRSGQVLEWYAEIFQQTQTQLGLSFHRSSGVVPHGRAGLTLALQHASALLASQRHGAVLLAGVDSYLNAATINHYLQAERLQVPGNSDGFIPGEAAAAVLLEMAPSSRTGVRIVGFGEAQEVGRPDGSVPSRAQGLTQAVRTALDRARLSYADLAFRLSDQNGEAFFAREAANALTRLAPVGGQKLSLITLADSLGEIGAATGPAMLAQLFMHMQHPSSPGRSGLLHLANDDGRRAAAVLQYT